ncbi:hypothetical protein B566_EDAN016333 [Ephemera danica]|nr:hypothetical protein B566_EDAN016333 [Ephemera danica]
MCPLALVTNLNSQLQEKLTTLLFEGKTLGEKPLSKDDSPPLKRSKPNPPEEGSGGTSIQHPMMKTAVAVSKEVKPQVDLPSTSRDNGLIALPSTSRDGVHPSFDLDDYENESSDVAVVTKTEEFEETTQPSVAQSSANTSTKDSSSSDDLWLPTWPLGKLRENDDGTLVELMNGVWLGTRQWDGIETSKDSAKFVKELAFALCGNDIANQSFTGKKSNRYYIQFLKKEDTLFQVQKRDKKTNELEIDLKKVNSNISSWFGEKSYSVRGKQAKKGK